MSHEYFSAFFNATSSTRNLVLMSIALAIITLSVYIPVGNHQFLNLDDNLYVTENLHVSSGITWNNIVWAFTSVGESTANWHPITWLSHMADAQIFGMNPRGHHLTNVVIHTLSSLLLLILLFRISGSLWQSSFVAALFALHPLHVESVAWVAERKDVLSAFFMFLTLIFYSNYVVNRKPVQYLLTLFSFILGLMSKPMLVTLPIVMLLMDFWPLNRYSPKEQESVRHPFSDTNSPLISLLKEKIPFFACSLFSAVITICAQRTGGAMSNLDVLPLGLRIENAIAAYGKYIAQTFWPHDLAILYPFKISLQLWQTLCLLFILFLVSAIAIWFRRQYPYYLVGWFWFIITLVPVIGLIQVGAQSLADRYMYIPQTGLFIMIAWGVSELTKSLMHRVEILSLLSAAVIMITTILTWQQLSYWKDNITLYSHALNVTSGHPLIHNNLGNALAEQGNMYEGIRECKQALRKMPQFSDAHASLGKYYFAIGDIDTAIKECTIAIEIDPNNVKSQKLLDAFFGLKGKTK